MPAGGWALVGVTVGDVSSSATAIGTGGVAVLPKSVQGLVGCNQTNMSTRQSS